MEAWSSARCRRPTEQAGASASSVHCKLVKEQRRLLGVTLGYLVVKPCWVCGPSEKRSSCAPRVRSFAGLADPGSRTCADLTKVKLTMVLTHRGEADYCASRDRLRSAVCRSRSFPPARGRSSRISLGVILRADAGLETWRLEPPAKRGNVGLGETRRTWRQEI